MGIGALLLERGLVSTAEVEEAVAEFAQKVDPFLTQEDLSRILLHRNQ